MAATERISAAELDVMNRRLGRGAEIKPSEIARLLAEVGRLQAEVAEMKAHWALVDPWGRRGRDLDEEGS